MTTPTPQAELVLRGGVIRTLDPSNSVASAVAVRGERIVGRLLDMVRGRA